ncbi:hypothetical protein Q3G72_009749 [Acer saccharum]|nr:hypothetical protein Q3G72_009749 [Acer saccharum]
MITRKHSKFFLLFKATRRSATTCTFKRDPPPLNTNSVSSSSSSDHKLLCFSLVEQLLDRGLMSSAQKVFQRMIAQSSSVPDAISVADFAIVRGMDLDLGGYGALIAKLIEFDQPQMVLSLYRSNIASTGMDRDPNILNSMIICFCKLGKFDDARTHFDKLMSMEYVPSKFARYAILKDLHAQERFLEAFGYFARLSDAGVNMGFWLCNILIDGLCYKGCLNEAMEVFDIMQNRLQLQPTLHLYKSLFYGLCKRGYVIEAESLFTEIESQGFFIDKMMYTSIMKGYCKEKRMKMAMRVCLRMLKMGFEPDNYTCNTLIHGFVKMGLYDKARVVYNQMNGWGLQPDVITYHIMISNYCKERKLVCALTLLNNISSNLTLSVHSYTVLIAALYKENRLTEVDELYKQMLDNGVVPDHVLSFILMKKCPKGQELQLAYMVLQAVAKNGCGFDPLSLSTSATENSSGDLNQAIELLLEKIVKSNPNLANVAFGIYISALCQAGQTDIAFLCMDKMVSLGCKPLLFTFNTLVKCLCLEGLFGDAKLLIELMEDSGMVPDSETYLITVTEYCKRGDLGSAFDVLDQIEARGMIPSVAIYDTIIRRLSREKRILEAEDMFKRMLELGVDPDEVVYMTMINAYSDNGRTFEARQLFEKMIENSIQPGPRCYTALISGLVKIGMTDKGCMYLHRMLGDGFVPNAVLYTSLVNCFLSKGDFEFAFRLVDLMDRNQIEHDLISYIALVSGFGRHMICKKRWYVVNRGPERAREMLFQLLHQRTPVPREKNIRVSIDSLEGMKCFALKLMRKVKEIQFMPNLYLYNCIIFGFCGAGRLQDAYDHFEMMQREDVRPNQVTFTILINGHIIDGDIDNAIRLFNKMSADGFPPDRIAHNTLLKGLSQAGRLPDALSILYRMKKSGFFPNKVSYEHLLRCLCASYSSYAAFKIFEEMIGHSYFPRLYSLNWLICILCEDKYLHEARLVLDTMHKIGKFPSNLTKELLGDNFAADPAVFHDVIAITSLPLLLGAAQQGKYFSGFDCNRSSTTSTTSAIDIDGRKRNIVGLAGSTRPLTALRRSLLLC